MRIGFVATRIAGLDGVSLEINKWAEVLRRLGHEPFFCAGELGEYAQPGLEAPPFHFQDPEAVALHDEAFSGAEESRALYDAVAPAFEHILLEDETEAVEDFEALAQQQTSLGGFVTRLNAEMSDNKKGRKHTMLARARELGLAAFRNRPITFQGLERD